MDWVYYLSSVDNLNYDNVFVEREKGSEGVMVSSADEMQFSGCNGQIISTIVTSKVCTIIRLTYTALI